MGDRESNPTGTERKPASPQVLDFLRLFGHAVNTAVFYGIRHKLPQQALTEAAAVLASVTAQRGDFTLGLADRALIFDGQPVDTRNALIAALTRKLVQLEAQSLTFAPDTSLEELTFLAEVLALPVEEAAAYGGFAACLAQAGLPHVRVEAASYQKVGEGDLLLRKDNVLETLASAAAGGEANATIQQIVAFLKGDTGSDGQSPEKVEQDSALNAARLADLIFRAVEVRAQPTAVDTAESLVDMVLGSLRRHVDELMVEPAAHTRQGRKNLTKTLLLLEKEVLERLRAAGVEERECAPVAAVIEELGNDLRVDALAAEYVKRRAAMETTEGKVMKYLGKSHGRMTAAVSALKEKLLEEGLSLEGWNELCVRGEVPAEPTAAARDTAGAGGLGVGAGGESSPHETQLLLMLLARLDALLDAGDEEPKAHEASEEFREVTREIGACLDSVTRRTGAKLRQFAEVAREMNRREGMTRTEKQAALTKAKLLAILAELVQELCQPLSVVNCTHDMFQSGRLGSLTADQEEMLQLASASGLRLQQLIVRLRDICGNPDGLAPDREILDFLYGKKE